MRSRTERRTPLTDILRERIGREGRLTFAAFMEACLYHPEFGYYSRPAPETAEGDYFTSPDLGPLFARLLTRQFAEMWEALERPRRFDLVECGGGRGRLGEQILLAAREQSPEFASNLQLLLVEKGSRRRAQAAAGLTRFGGQVSVAEELPEQGIVGCLFSNELLDALPVHRVLQREDGLREIFVAAREGELVEEEGELSSPALAEYLARFGCPLEPGQEAEVGLAALDWLERAAAALERGFLLTVDYGHRARELYAPGHRRGTLLAFHQHRAHEDWLACPGEQDLTAQVNFTALIEHGRGLGLETLGYTEQASFLLALARASQLADLELPGRSEREQLLARQAFKQLIHPEAMGESFKVLIQVKGVGRVPLAGLAPL